VALSRRKSGCLRTKSQSQKAKQKKKANRRDRGQPPCFWLLFFRDPLYRDRFWVA